MKSQNLKVRISEQEKRRIDKFCAKNRIKISQYIRDIIAQSDKKEIRIITSNEVETFSKVTYQLQKIGVSINQIAHFFNLEHLKNLDKKSRELSDILLLDKLKKDQLEDIKSLLNILRNEVENLTNKLASYDKK